MESEQKQFLLKEYDKLSAEVAKLLDETRTREKYSLTIIAAIAAWIYTEIIKNPATINGGLGRLLPIIRVLSWVPLIITVMYGVSVLLIYRNIKWIGAYLKRIEEMYLENITDKAKMRWGWEYTFQKKRLYFVAWTWIFWILQILISVIVICKSNAAYQ